MIVSKKELSNVLSEITGIEDVANIEPSTISVATRMSWASKRECTREEDNAYCLMGIFSINMPLLYGEGDNAFRRLQLEILKTSDDESLFAWWESHAYHQILIGLLASSPHALWNSRDISPYPFYVERAPYDMTNKGLQIEASLIPCGWIFEMEKDAFPLLSSTNSPALAVNNQIVGDSFRLRSDRYRPLPYSPSEPAQKPHTWIFPLNCRIRSNRRPVVLILTDWGAKSGQCCRLFSERYTDESFGPEWNTNANWRAFGSITRLTYIREADSKAHWALARKINTPILVGGALTSHEHGSIEDVFLWDVDSRPDDVDEPLDDGEPWDKLLTLPAPDPVQW